MTELISDLDPQELSEHGLEVGGGTQSDENLANLIKQAQGTESADLRTWSVDSPLERILLLKKTGSTQDLLTRLREAREFERNAAVIALEQTNGHGAQKRPWISSPGNLYLSFVKNFADSISREESFDTIRGNFAVMGKIIFAKLLADSLKEMLGEKAFQGNGVIVRPPNDLVFKLNQKFAGILPEGDIVGLGLNLTEMDPTDKAKIKTDSALRNGVTSIEEICADIGIKVAPKLFPIFLNFINRVENFSKNLEASGEDIGKLLSILNLTFGEFRNYFITENTRRQVVELYGPDHQTLLARGTLEGVEKKDGNPWVKIHERRDACDSHQVNSYPSHGLRFTEARDYSSLATNSCDHVW